MTLGTKCAAIEMRWLGRQGSNLRITGSKPVALPLGYAPTRRGENISEQATPLQRRKMASRDRARYNRVTVDASMPWSLKGISDEAREYARDAAGAADIPIGDWLSAVINAAALQEQSASTPIDDGGDGLLDDLVPVDRSGIGDGNTIERTVRIVSDFGLEPEGPARDEDLFPEARMIEDVDLLEAELDSLERRLAAAEDQSSETVGPLTTEIERLRQRLESIRNG